MIWVKKVHVAGHFRQALHQFEALLAHGLQLIDSGLVVLLFGKPDVGQGDGIKIIVSQGDEAEAATTQFNNFLNDAVDRALARTLSIGAPYGTKRAVFGASAHGLHGGPHIAVRRKEVPAGLLEVLRFHFAAVVNAFRLAGRAVSEHAVPNQVAVALNHRMGTTVHKRFFRIEGGMDSAEHHPGAALAYGAAHLVSAQGVVGVNANAHDVARLDTLEVEVLQSFIADFGIAEGLVQSRRPGRRAIGG